MKNIPQKISPIDYTLRSYLKVFLMAPWLFFPLMVVIFFPLLSTDIDPFVLSEFYDFIYLRPYLYIGFLLVYIFIFLSVMYIKKSLQSIEQKLSRISEQLHKDSPPDEILERCKELYSIIKQKLLIIRLIPLIFSEGSSRAYISSMRKYIDYFTHQILQDIRGDLVENLREQKERVRGANESLSLLSGVPELESTTETQKLRLDRQIEQFEELQRVLVKV